MGNVCLVDCSFCWFGCGWHMFYYGRWWVCFFCGEGDVKVDFVSEALLVLFQLPPSVRIYEIPHDMLATSKGLIND